MNTLDHWKAQFYGNPDLARIYGTFERFMDSLVATITKAKEARV